MVTRVYYVKTTNTQSAFPAIVDGIGAYLSYTAATIAVREYMKQHEIEDDTYMVECSEIEDFLIGRNVLYMRLYRGYDYDYDTGRIQDMTSHIGVYPNLTTLQNTKLYQDCLEELKKGDPDDFLQLTDGSIGHRDSSYNDDLFFYGDCYEHKWSLCVERLRVYKGDEDSIKYHIRSLKERAKRTTL